jgi:hypothetical protein
MAGTPIGSVDHFIGDPSISNGGPELNQAVFKIVFDFMQQMVSAGYATRIALEYGASYTPAGRNTWGTGTDFYDGATPFGEGAFAVYRMNGLSSGNTESARNGVDLPDFDYYILIQWYTYNSWNTAPGAPSTLKGSTASNGVGVQMAVREDGASPWNGTTNNDGTDTKGTPVWTDGGSTAHVFPMSNNSGGSYSTNRENCMRVNEDFYNNYSRVSVIGSADSVIFVTSEEDTNEYRFSYVGVYEPRAGLSPSLPLVAIMRDAAGGWSDGSNDVYGSIAGNDQKEGGVLGNSLSDGVTQLSVGFDVAGVDFQPNNFFDPPEFDVFPLRVTQRGTGKVGYVGDLDTALVLTSYGNKVNNRLSSDGTRALVSGITIAGNIFSVSWGGIGFSPPASLNQRAGAQF